MNKYIVRRDQQVRDMTTGEIKGFYIGNDNWFNRNFEEVKRKDLLLILLFLNFSNISSKSSKNKLIDLINQNIIFEDL